MLLQQVASTLGLMISEPYTMVLVAVLGYLLINEAFFAKALMLLLFTMIYNAFLKSVWQIPLPPDMNLEGWAFPSGHMHSAFIFWGWIAFDSKNKYVMAIAFLLLSFTGFGLVDKGYHYPIDIIGAICFGSLTIAIFHVLNSFQSIKANYSINGIYLSILACIFFLLTPNAVQKMHLFQGLGSLMGFTLGALFAAGRYIKVSSKLRQFSFSAIVILIAIGIFKLSLLLQNLVPPPIMIYCSWFCIGLWIAGSKGISLPARPLNQPALVAHINPLE